jgi:serine/threonine protein kinase
MSDLARWIDGLDAGAVVVCLDCCHAGKVLGQRDPTPAPAARNMELRPALLQRMSGQGRYLIASCDEGQKSYECADLGHGLFTFYLLRGIAGEADRDGDGRVGLAELFNYVSLAVSRDARQRFGCEQKPWTSATWADETYISSVHSRTLVAEPDPLERLWREQGAAAAVQEIERTIPGADEESVQRSLRLLGRMKESTGIPAIFRCLAHASEAVRKEARSALHALNWEIVVGTVEELARSGDPVAMTAVLDGLNAFEAHPQVVGLLDRLVVPLKGDLRNRAVLLLKRKRLGLGLEKVTALFREIQSPYQPRKALGQGPFTASYLARAEGSELDVVVRVLLPEFVQQPHVRAGFFDLCMQSLHFVHENLVLTREARAFPGHEIYYAVRDYINGVTLQTVLESGKRFEPAQAVQILRQTAAALTPLHRKGIYHGGIKPSNIFLCADDHVVLGDPSLHIQGVGVALDCLAYDYRYAPPELFRAGEAPGPAADFYALGCVAYELFCGAPPFVSDSWHELTNRHVHEPIRFPDPAPLICRLGIAEDFLLPLLAKSASDRFSSLKDVIQALDLLPGHFHTCSSTRASPLVRDASIVNYQGAQSVLDFDRTGASVTGESDAGTPPSEAKPEELPQIPGYKVLQVLGQGGMGTVYKAEQKSLNREVVLKAVRLGTERSSLFGARLQREAMVIGQLQHPNIVQVFDIIERQGQAFLVMELVEGGDLARKLAEGPLPFREAAELVATLSRAVHYAHQQHVLHRDLKPSNVLLTSEGEPKITDFGLAKRLKQLGDDAALTDPGTPMGTPHYMAPEQFQGRADPATDVYGLGTILYELLTGLRAFSPSLDPAQLMFRILQERPTPPISLRPSIPPELETVCLKCLEKDPARRYASAAALAEDLECWLQGEPIAARPPSMWQRLARFFTFGRSGKPPPGDRARGA